MKSFFIALQFLTILPIRIKGELKEGDFGKALTFFPVIGALLGTFLFALAYYLRNSPPLFSAALILVIYTILTGAIHLDGLADTCDGFYAGKTKENILRIMRDSAIGTMGVIGIILILLLKFSLIASFPRVADLGKALIVALSFSRWSQAVACLNSSYARQDGKAKFFLKGARKIDIALGGLFSLGLFILFFNWQGIFIFILSLLITLLFISYSKRRINGMTGDTIGALNEIMEVTVLSLALIAFNYA
ncbi:MAG: adenosylcobinamide-GDP ribazoletransferase [Candidatus Omnitrophota bacterium]